MLRVRAAIARAARCSVLVPRAPAAVTLLSCTRAAAFMTHATSVINCRRMSCPQHHRRARHSSTSAAPSASTPAPPASIASQQDRWNALRTLTASLLTDRSTAGQPTEWVHLPSLRDAPSSHAHLQAARNEADIEDDATLKAYLASRQQLPAHLHNEPILLTPTVRTLWKRLAAWDRRQQVQTMERAKEEAVDQELGTSTASSANRVSTLSELDDADESPPGIRWSSRGLFLDGPNGVSKSTSLYTLACMARSQNWLVVHIADAEAWLAQLGDGGATRMFVQAVYEAAAATILPGTETWSAPHSLLQMPLSQEMEYAATLIEQGIGTFGELLTLSLELQDGAEEAELAVECIVDQLFHVDAVPVLFAVDGFDALTQKCLQAPGSASSDPNDASDAPDLVAPLTVSPFSHLNFHRAPAFRGGFLITGESFALVQQAQPEMMERTRTVEEDDEDEEEGDAAQTEAPKRTNAMKRQQVDPIHVSPIPPLSPALSREYLLHRFRRTPSLSSSFLLAPSLSSTYFPDLHHRVHSGIFTGMEGLLEVPEVASQDLVPVERVRESYLASTNAANLRAYAEYFSTRAARRGLAAFFAQNLPAGFYRDLLRRAGEDARRKDGMRVANVARDYNLVAVNAGESRAMVEWVHQHLPADAQTAGSADAPPRVVADSASWAVLTSNLPTSELPKPALVALQHRKVEALLQCVATALIVKGEVSFTDSPHTTSRPQSAVLPVSAVDHWCAVTDPPILQVQDLEPNALHAHWNPVASSTEDAAASPPATYLNRLVHVAAGSDGGPRALTLIVGNLDPVLSDLLFVAPHRPITALMHTLYLHYLADILKGLEVCTGPTVQVRAHAKDGSSYSWHELDDFLEAMQGGMFDAPDVDLPLQHATITHIEARPADASDAAQMPRVRVVFVSPFGRATAPLTPPESQPEAAASPSTDASATTPASSAASTPAPSSADASAASEPVAMHPLFAFVDTVIGADLARLLDVQAAEVDKIRWK